MRTTRPGRIGRPANASAAQQSPSDLELLTGRASTEVLASALAVGGGQLLAARSRQITHSPAHSGRPASTTVSYRARVRRDGGERIETVVATTRVVPASPSVVQLRVGDRPVAVWRKLDDPDLPGLRLIHQRDALTAFLTAHGLSPTGPIRLAARSYRPRRRAVFQMTAGELRLFIKVVRPAAIGSLSARHHLLSDAGLPVPRDLGCTAEGVLLLAQLPGHTVRQHLRSRLRPPAGAELVGLLETLPAELMELPTRRSWTAGVDHYAEILAAVAPTEAARVRQLAAEISSRVDSGQGSDPTHGDFYDAQLLVSESGTLTGLLDLDSTGPGHRADDLACLIAHAQVLAALEPAHRPDTLAAVEHWLHEFQRAGAAGGQRLDPVDLSLRVAGVLMSLATGPHRAGRAGWRSTTTSWIGLVEMWIAKADRG